MIPLSAVPFPRRIGFEFTRHEPCVVSSRLPSNRPPRRRPCGSLAVMHEETVAMRIIDRTPTAALGDAQRRHAAHLAVPSVPIEERCARVG